MTKGVMTGKRGLTGCGISEPYSPGERSLTIRSSQRCNVAENDHYHAKKDLGLENP
jgi:hypothetical protein